MSKPLKNQTILVTGGAGFIGSNLVDALAKDNQVIVLDDCSTGHEHNLEDALKTGNVTFVKGSILDQALLDEWLPQVDMVFHLAVQCLRLCFDRPEVVHEVNATGTLRLLETVQRLNPGLQKFIYVSSSEVYGTAKTVPMSEDHPLIPTTVYGASKLAGELYTQAHHITYGLPTVIVRPFNTYGYREHHEGFSGEVIPRFVVKLLNNDAPVIFGDGSATRDFTFVEDTVTGLVKIAESDALIGDTINLAYGQEVSIKAIGEKLLTLTEKADSLKLHYEGERPGDVHRHYAGIEKLKTVIGWQPQTNIDQGLEKYLSWFHQQYPDASLLTKDCWEKNWEIPNETAEAKQPALTV